MRYTPEQYSQALYALTNDKSRAEIKSAVEKFVNLLSKNGELSVLEKILESFKRLSLKYRGRSEVTVFHAGSIEKEKIKRIFGYKAEVEFKEEPDLIAGVKIQIDDLRINNTVKERLSALKKAF
jgi:F0F1-type ATP synthase delta subunit